MTRTHTKRDTHPDETPTVVRRVVKPRVTLPSKPPLTEKEWQQQIVDFARICGWLCYHTYDSRRSEPGFPDLCMVRGRSLIFAELKTQRGKISPYQTGWLEALRHVPGAKVYCWRPSDWPVVQDVLMHLGTQPVGDPIIYPMREASA